MGTTPHDRLRAMSQPDASSHLEHQVGVGAAWKLTGQIGIQVIRLLSVAALARLLRPGDYGAAAIAIALASFAPTVGDMGMGAALVQTESAPRVVRSTAFWASLGFGAVLSLLVLVGAGPIGELLGDDRVGPLVAVGGLTLVIYAVGSASQSVFMRDMRFRSVELRYWFALVVGCAAAVALAAAGAGAWRTTC